MEDEQYGSGLGEAFAGEADEAGVFADAGEGGTGEAFELDAEHVDDVDLVEDGVEIVRDGDVVIATHFFDVAGDEGAGADEGDFGPELAQAVDVGTSDAGVGDVADDGDVEAAEE